MVITKKEVKHLAKLARIELSEEEVDKFQKQITSILDYINKINRVVVDNTQKISLSENENILRIDEVIGFDNQKELLEQSPEYRNGHIKVKTILKKNETH